MIRIPARSHVSAGLLWAALGCLLPNLVQGQSAYQGDIDTWVAQDQLDPEPEGALLFVGSSSIRLWERLALDFSDWNVIQRGFGGSQFSDLNQFVDQVVTPYAPAAIFVFEGSNDINAGKTPAQVFADYQSFVTLVRGGQAPGSAAVPIVFIGVTPTPARQSQIPEVMQLNDMVQTYAQGDPSLYYADTPTLFLSTGTPPSSSLFLSDGLHLNQAGYDLWTSVLHPIAKGLMLTPGPAPLPAAHPLRGERVLFDFGPANPLDGSPTTSPDANGNTWNNWSAIAGATPILAGEHQGSLLTTAGVDSGFGIVISGEFQANGIRNGGLTQPDPLLLGDFAIPSATQDYFFSDADFLPGGFYLRGLDPRRSFDLRLFACRRADDARSSTYFISGANRRQADLVTSGPGSGQMSAGNDDTILELKGLRPDALGRLFVDLEPTVSGLAYLGILELRVGALRKQAPSAGPPPVQR